MSSFDATALQCARCSTGIGSIEPTSQGYQLHKPDLAITAPDKSHAISYGVNKWLSCQILAAIESQGVRKFTIQSTNSDQVDTFKIWVLTPDLTISSSAGPSSEPTRTMKVLWHDSNGQDENESDMKKFLTESDIKLSKVEMDQLLEALQVNSVWIPEGARELMGWNVGLLERFTNHDLAMWHEEFPMR